MKSTVTSDERSDAPGPPPGFAGLDEDGCLGGFEVGGGGDGGADDDRSAAAVGAVAVALLLVDVAPLGSLGAASDPDPPPGLLVAAVAEAASRL